MKAIAFFNNKGGVGKTTLVFHLAWMFSRLGYKVVVADLDPQANLTSMFLDEDRLEELWPDSNMHPQSILGSLQPIIDGVGDIQAPHIESVGDGIGLIVGDLALSRFEDRLSDAWPRSLDANQAAYRTMSAFYRLVLDASNRDAADLVLVDVGPNLGAINRAALVACEHVVVPLAPDLFSLQGLRNLGPTLRDWRLHWKDRLDRRPQMQLELPPGTMRPAGYVVMQHAVRLDRPVKAYEKWMRRIPGEYQAFMLAEKANVAYLPSSDVNCLAQLKHYRSLMPLAMEARKPMFALTVADGAIGAHQQAAVECGKDFMRLAKNILGAIGVKQTAQQALP